MFTRFLSRITLNYYYFKNWILWLEMLFEGFRGSVWWQGLHGENQRRQIELWGSTRHSTIDARGKSIFGLKFILKWNDTPSLSHTLNSASKQVFRILPHFVSKEDTRHSGLIWRKARTPASTSLQLSPTWSTMKSESPSKFTWVFAWSNLQSISLKNSNSLADCFSTRPERVTLSSREPSE